MEIRYVDIFASNRYAALKVPGNPGSRMLGRKRKFQAALLDGVAVKDVVFPGGTLLISLIRNGTLTIPNGTTVLRRGDELVAVSEERSQKALMKVLTALKK